MITDIRLQHFRSYHDSSFELSPGVNIIVGPNASGKTNLLEAVMVIAGEASYRARDLDLIQFENPWARLDAHTPTGERSVIIEKIDTGSRKSFIIDNQKLQRLLLPKTIPLTLFEPNHMQLLHGSPELRRNFLDDLLQQTITGYKQLRQQYRRALNQRNALLKHGSSVAKDQLFTWNVRLSELGEQTARYRTGLIERINQELPAIYNTVSKKDHNIAAEYQSSVQAKNYGSHMLSKLEAHNQLDTERGFTSVGPHRDDLAIRFDGRPLQQAASRGETRTMTLALKIVELKLLQEARNTPPILLLDDVFSELDGARRHALTGFLHDYQTFITTTDADVVLQHFTDKCNIIPTP